MPDNTAATADNHRKLVGPLKAKKKAARKPARKPAAKKTATKRRK